MNAIALRIKNLIDEKKMNISSFEKKIGVGNNSIGTIIRKNSNVSGDILSKILNIFNDVSAEWLLTGNSEMLKTTSFCSQKEVVNSLNELENDYKSKDFLENEILFLKEKITMLEQERDFLKQIIKPSSEEKSNCA